MRARTALWLIVGIAATYGCSRQETTPCEPEARYATARSAQPVQIPDDLSPPEEEDALRLPPDLSESTTAIAGECLEAPPSFFGESRPFRRGDEEADREQEREVRPAQTPSSDGDRVIDN
jgi:hypothetical protein